MKDVVACDKPRGAGKQALIRDFRMGKPDPSGSSHTEYIDVSVPPVRLINLWIQLMIVCRNTLGFPIRKSPVITVHITLPTLIAD